MMDKLREFLTEVLADEVAVNFCCDLYHICQIWDDLVDQDQDVDIDDVNQSFEIALIELDRNPFFLKHRLDLRPLITLAILQWHHANELEKTKEDKDLQKAFMLRAGINQIYCYCAFLIHGLDYAKKIGPAIQRFYSEDMNDYLTEIKNA